jgi:hypothetical protein
MKEIYRLINGGHIYKKSERKLTFTLHREQVGIDNPFPHILKQTDITAR